MRANVIKAVVIPRLLLCGVLVLWLSACQFNKAILVKDSELNKALISGQQQPLLADVVNAESWRYTAKVGITTQALREQANMVWAFADQSNDVRLFGPLGAGAIKLEFDQYGVQLSDSKGGLHLGANAEELLAELVGWPIPIDSLSYWLLAHAAPDSNYRYSLDELGQVKIILQLGWQISYADYRDYGERKLPRKVTAIKDFGDSGYGKVIVKLIAKTWSASSDGINND